MVAELDSARCLPWLCHFVDTLTASLCTFVLSLLDVICAASGSFRGSSNTQDCWFRWQEHCLSITSIMINMNAKLIDRHACRDAHGFVQRAYAEAWLDWPFCLLHFVLAMHAIWLVHNTPVCAVSSDYAPSSRTSLWTESALINTLTFYSLALYHCTLISLDHLWPSPAIISHEVIALLCSVCHLLAMYSHEWHQQNQLAWCHWWVWSCDL